MRFFLSTSYIISLPVLVCLTVIFVSLSILIIIFIYVLNVMLLILCSVILNADRDPEGEHCVQLRAF